MNTLKIKKYRVLVKNVTHADINMATTNVSQKESDMPSAKNHFARVCRSTSDAIKGVHLLEEEACDDELFVGCITSINTVELSEWYEELTVQIKAVKFQLDTGAKCNVLPYKVIEDLEIQCHFPNQVKVMLRSSNSYLRSSDIAL